MNEFALEDKLIYDYRSLWKSYLEAIHAQEVLVPIISYWSATREPILTLENVEGLEIPPKEHEEKQDSSPNEDLAKNHKDNLRVCLDFFPFPSFDFPFSSLLLRFPFSFVGHS